MRSLFRPAAGTALGTAPATATAAAAAAAAAARTAGLRACGARASGARGCGCGGCSCGDSRCHLTVSVTVDAVADAARHAGGSGEGFGGLAQASPRSRPALAQASSFGALGGRGGLACASGR